ncbi:MAG: site-specific DNA-methyltransferase [Caldilineaceae bacterium]|nr:site-specific DNA-methyltransferase [Caldilineaceae bacterium]
MTNSPKPTRTQTSAFGSPGRENHDASAFYASRLYAGLPQEEKVPLDETPLAAEQLDRIFLRSAEQMTDLPDNCVHLMVTSPPYNVGKEYDEDFTLDEYLAFLEQVWREVWRVLVPGGRACINIANLGRKPYLPLNAFIARQMYEIGFLMRGEIIWNKAGHASPSTAWGSWKSPSNPTLRDVHEYILVFSKQRFGRSKKRPGDQPDREPTISRDDFLEHTKSVWTFPPEPARRVGHPAPFPVELPRRLIELYTFAGEVVLDPFMGSGQTAIAALRTGRRYVGYEVSEEYAALAKKRIDDEIRG